MPLETAAAKSSEPKSPEKARQHTRQVLSELCQDFFVLGLRIERGQVELPDCEAFRKRLLLLFESLSKRAAEAGVTHGETDEARYALVAYLDEVIQYSAWPGKHAWAQHPLQAIFYGDSKAGRRFFAKLSELRLRNSAALEIYYTCLVLGFRGEYRMGNEGELQQLIDDLAQDLAPAQIKKLSPHGLRPDERALGHGTTLSLPVIAAGLGLTLLIVLLLWGLISWSGADALETLQTMTRSAA